MITKILITKQAKKGFEKAPQHIKEKFSIWAEAVNKVGLMEVRKHLGWHDELLHKDKYRDKGQRSIRLNKQWRAIYVIKEDGKIEFIEIVEVTPHDYKK